jgi:hypothetical protein
LRDALEQARAETRDWSDRQLTETLVGRSLQTCLDQLSATGVWGEANRVASGELWRVAGEQLRRGELQLQARQKPRGYAGDFDMLRKICEEWTCADPLGRAFDQFFQDQAAPRSVRNRTRIVANQLSGAVRRVLASGLEAARIVSVGAGPAIDVQLGLEELHESERRRVLVSLLDMDPEALEHASLRLQGLISPDQITLCRENLFRLPRLARVQVMLNDADFISCAGLFDYLDSENATAMLSCFWKHLRSGGEAIVFNFSPGNNSRAYMEWIGNWYLTYRDKDELAELSQAATAYDARLTVAEESSQTSLFVVCAKD